jgi:colanic acid/amylovoran biosynthesis glycosyltransferase
MTDRKFHILYILRSFPTVTEMSTLNEITGMIRRGMEVSIVSLKTPEDLKHLHDDVEKYHLADRTFYLNVSTGIKKWKNILLRTIYGHVKLFLKANISLNNKIKVSTYSVKKKSRRLSLVHLVDLINHIAEKKPDVIYFHFGTHAGELIILRRIFRIPFVVFFHGYDFSKELPYDELNYPGMFRYGDWFFTNSNFAGMKVEGLGCPKNKLTVTGLPVDDHQYPYQVRSKKDRVRILTVGRLVEKKGLEYSIEAVSRLLKDYPDLEYNIIGDGPLETSLQALIRSYGAEGKINLLGSRKKAEVIEMMLGSDIFLLSSVTAKDGETEGLPMVSLESQLTGMPIIATLHSGFTDSILDGVSGFLVPERDVEALHDRLSWLIGHPETWESMGKAGRQHVLDNFSEQVYLDKILSQIYKIRENF